MIKKELYDPKKATKDLTKSLSGPLDDDPKQKIPGIWGRPKQGTSSRLGKKPEE